MRRTHVRICYAKQGCAVRSLTGEAWCPRWELFRALSVSKGAMTGREANRNTEGEIPIQPKIGNLPKRHPTLR
ncbi:MAG: hypothetical protein ACON4O_05560 [Lentimonas sp.]